jgi:hypothetical protein
MVPSDRILLDVEVTATRDWPMLGRSRSLDTGLEPGRQPGRTMRFSDL